MKKFGALVVALMMIMSLSATALAAEVTTQNGTSIAATGSSTSFTIPKEIVLFNTTAGTGIYEPNVTYTYKLTSGAAGAVITDDPASHDPAGSVKATVKAGLGGVTITGTSGSAQGVGGEAVSVVFGDGDHSAAASYGYPTLAEGAVASTDTTQKASRNITVTIDPTSSAFQGTDGGQTKYVPGVYRYTITEDSNTADENGVKLNANHDTALTLDVYLKWNSAHDGLEVYGYVLFKDLEQDPNLTFDGSGTATTTKISGYDVSSGLNDEYHTYNATINKQVAGAMGDQNHPFPFTIELTGVSGAEFYYTRTGGTATRNIAASDDALLTLASGAVSISTDLKHSETINLFGLPYNTEVAVTEKNDTPDYYTPSVTFDGAAITSPELTIENDFVPASPYNTAHTVAFHNDKAVDADININRALTADAIVFTNTLNQVSPTGVVLRVAPYALMLGAGIALFIILKVRKNKAAEEA